LAEKMRLMRNFGFAGYDNVIHPGTNGKMIEVCAAMGLANLNSFYDIVEINKRNYAAYHEALAAIPGITLLPYDPIERNSHHYIVIEVGGDCRTSRDEIVAALQAENILARKYFWPGCHRMKPYRDLFPHAGLMLSNTERIAERLIVLPTGSNLPDDAIGFIADLLRVVTATPVCA
jgi:dTDP-4-amino-4,6-dideoxygalactose transaminase